MSDYFQNKYRIDSHRLKGWDYRTPGWYFVTICTYEGIEYFGDVHTKIMGLSEIGCIVWKYWDEIPDHQQHVQLGEFIVMPNHVHLTIRLTNKKIEKSNVETCCDMDGSEGSDSDDTRVKTLHGEEGLDNRDSDVTSVETFHETSLHNESNDQGDIQNEFMSSISPKSGSLSVIIRLFKGAVHTWCKQNDHGDFAWQPGFYDHIVRNNASLERINEYIRTNPEYWEEDRYHPENFTV